MYARITNTKCYVAKKASIKELNNEIYNPLETQEELNQQNNIVSKNENTNEPPINENIGTNIDNLPEPTSNETNIGSNI